MVGNVGFAGPNTAPVTADCGAVAAVFTRLAITPPYYLDQDRQC
jgi:hypothetical protein